MQSVIVANSHWPRRHSPNYHASLGALFRHSAKITAVCSVCLEMLFECVSAHSLNLGRSRAAVIQAIEEQLERGVRLSSECYFGPQHEHSARADVRFDYCRSSLQILLPPRPAALKR